MTSSLKDETTSSQSSSRLGMCEVCDQKPSKYTCPRCDVKTCGLACNKIHKEELECNGIRDKTLYKPLKKFGNLDLLSDYRLLEDITRSVIKYKKNSRRHYYTRELPLPPHLARARKAAQNRGVNLMLLPQTFSRHIENTSFFKIRTNEFFWRIEWIFPSGTEERKYIDERVLDKEKLGTALAKYLSPEEEDPALELYYSANFRGITVLMKVEKTLEKFQELDLSVSLRQNFRGKKILEFPTIYVILAHHKEMYDLVESDDEELDNNKESTVIQEEK